MLSPALAGGLVSSRVVTPDQTCPFSGTTIKMPPAGTRFPETAHHLAGRSPVMAPALHRGSFPQKSGCHDHIPPRSAPLTVPLQRVRKQYRDMPGLKLTTPQATRLFGVAPSVCAAMLRALVMENFLSRTETACLCDRPRVDEPAPQRQGTRTWPASFPGYRFSSSGIAPGRRCPRAGPGSPAHS